MSAENKSTISISIAAQVGTAEKSQWVQIIPMGQSYGRDGRGPYTIKSIADANKVIEASMAWQRGADIAVDYDHQTDLAVVAKLGGTARAAGWIKEFSSRDDGIWGRIEWTPQAAQMVKDKEYRYLSPVFAHTADGIVTRIVRASITNNPNLELMALASAENAMDNLKELRQLLGLAPDADMLVIIAAVQELMTTQHASAPDPSKYVPIEALEKVTTQLNTINAGVSLQAAESAVAGEIKGGTLPPFLKDWAVSLCSVNKPAFDAFVAKTKGGFAYLSVEQHLSAHSSGNNKLSREEHEVFTALGHDPKILQESN